MRKSRMLPIFAFATLELEHVHILGVAVVGRPDKGEARMFQAYGHNANLSIDI